MPYEAGRLSDPTLHASEVYLQTEIDLERIRQRLRRYLDWLNAGNIGRHWEALRSTTEIERLS